MPKDVPRCAVLLDETIADLRPTDKQNGFQHEITQQLMAMGGRYETGDGVMRDLVQAAAWYRRASTLGDADGVLAQATLARNSGQPPEREI